MQAKGDMKTLEMVSCMTLHAWTGNNKLIVSWDGVVEVTDYAVFNTSL